MRASSHSTLDSMEFGHYSDDLDKDTNDRVAVLEFELRKALETIKSLRGSLTKATGGLAVDCGCVFERGTWSTWGGRLVHT